MAIVIVVALVAGAVIFWLGHRHGSAQATLTQHVQALHADLVKALTQLKAKL